jgi:glutamine synthetase
MSSVRLAEYIWVDGTRPSPRLRSKTRVIGKGEEPSIWGFDGSSTNQAEGHASDCVLKPVCTVPDSSRRNGSILVLCEVLKTSMDPHETNTRHWCVEAANRYRNHHSWFGLEQEYTLFRDGRPLGFPENGYPAPQGQYYCSAGASNAFGREIVEEHLDACLEAGLGISGINAEVMPGQWEFQVGPLGPTEVSDHLWLARYLLERIAEKHGVSVCWAPKPVKGDWNGAGCHTNFSTIEMRTQPGMCEKAAAALGEKADEHIAIYGDDIESRLTGDHETCSHEEFRWGVSDRGASIRIPWQVAIDGVGYIEDRRPNSNCDPYLVTTAITETVCSALWGV